MTWGSDHYCTYYHSVLVCSVTVKVFYGFSVALLAANCRLCVIILLFGTQGDAFYLSGHAHAESCGICWNGQTSHMDLSSQGQDWLSHCQVGIFMLCRNVGNDTAGMLEVSSKVSQYNYPGGCALEL